MAECIEEGTLRAYADCALTPEPEASVSMHLAQCEGCSRNLAEVSALASEVGLLVAVDSHPPDARLALAQVRGMMRTATGRTFADVSPPVVAFKGEAPKLRAYPRPMRLQPVAMGVGLGAAMVAVLVLLFAVSGLQQTASKPASEFVPRGMVREMTISHTITTPDSTPGEPASTFTETVWLANGNNHLLMYSTYQSERNGSSTWVEEEAVYSRQIYPYGENIIRKFPYDARHLELYVPNEISYLLTLPNAKIVGEDILDGWPVTVIEAIADKTPPTPRPESTELVVLAATDYKLWVDKETSQVLQREHKTTFLEGSNKGATQTQTFKVSANELKNVSQFAPDFFKFKPREGITVVDSPSPFEHGDAVDAKEPTPTFPQGIGESIILSSWVSNWDVEKSGWEVFPIDPATGKAVPGYEPFVISRSKEHMGQIQLSPKGTRLVVTEARNSVSWPWAGGVSTQGSADVLHLIDVQAWREVTATLSSEQAVGQLAFTDDGRQLAVNLSRYNTESVGMADELVLLDAATGVIIARRDLEIHPSRIEFSGDGSRLVVFGQHLGASPAMDKPGPLRVMLLDGATLKTVWEHTLDGIVGGYWCESNCDAPHEQKVFASWGPAVTFSPDRDKLYIVHADSDKLTTIDFAAQKVHSVDIAEARSWLESLLDLTASKAEAKARINGVDKFAALSADGTQLYVTGQNLDAKRDPEAEALGLQVIDIKSGRKVAGIESDLFGLGVCHEGKQIFLSGLRDDTQVTDVLDAATLKRVTTIENWRVTPVRWLNGQPIIMANQHIDNQTQYGLMDPQTFKVTSTWLAPRNMGLVARGDR